MNLIKFAQLGVIATIAAASLTACHKRDETTGSTDTKSSSTASTTTPDTTGTAGGKTGTSGTTSDSTSTMAPGAMPPNAASAPSSASGTTR